MVQISEFNNRVSSSLQTTTSVVGVSGKMMWIFSLFLYLSNTDWSSSWEWLSLRLLLGIHWPTLSFQRPHFHFPVTRWDLCLDDGRRQEDSLLIQFAFIEIKTEGQMKTFSFFNLLGCDIQFIKKISKPLCRTLYLQKIFERVECLFAKLQSWVDTITWTPVWWNPVKPFNFYLYRKTCRLLQVIYKYVRVHCKQYDHYMHINIHVTDVLNTYTNLHLYREVHTK